MSVSGPSEAVQSPESGPWRLTAHRDHRTAVVVVVVHLGALLAPFTLTWQGVAAFSVLGYVTLAIGLILGFHRLLTHRSFQTSKLVEHLIAVVGCLGFEGGPIRWVATHRLHHRHPDRDRDPHSPRHGFFWSHVAWNFFEHPDVASSDGRAGLAPELAKDPVHRFLDEHFLLVNGVFLVACLGSAHLLWGGTVALSVLTWGFFLRVACVWHATWLVNSVTHRFGYRNFDVPDQSTNVWWVALLTFGEGWHNNHHARPRCASFRHAWYELDLTYVTVKVMELVGLAWNVRRPSTKVQADIGAGPRRRELPECRQLEDPLTASGIAERSSQRSAETP